MTDLTDLVDRLKHYEGDYHAPRGLLTEAADEILRLRALIAPGEGCETTAWERDQWRYGVNPFSKEDRERLLRDFNRVVANSLRETARANEATAALAAAEEREAEWAKGRRPFQNQNAVIAAQVKRIDDLNAALAAEKERADALHDLAKKIGKALLRFTPDGSEYYVKVHDDYYADAEACQRIIQNTRDTQYEVIKKFAAERDAERAARVKAEDALREAEAYDGVDALGYEETVWDGDDCAMPLPKVIARDFAALTRRAEAAEASLAALRDAARDLVAASRFALSTPGMIKGRGELVHAVAAADALLPTQPTQDDDSPVPALTPDMGKVEEALKALPKSIIDKFIRELNSWGDQCCGGAGQETNPVNDLPYGHVYYSAAAALSQLRS